MKVPLAEPLAPGKVATLEMAWHFLVPEHGADRMGRDGSLYEIAQWYPRAAVYDDLRGWNNDPYIGQGEFYLDYGDYNVVGDRARRLHRRRDRDARESEGRADADAARAARRGAEERQGRAHHHRRRAQERRGAPDEERDAHLEVPREERARRGVGRVARVSVGRDELQGRIRLRVLPAERRGPVDGIGRHGADVDPGVLGALVPVSVAADLRGRGTDERHGVPDARDGGSQPEQAGAVQRDHARDRAQLVPDDRRLERARVHVAGRGVQHVHQHVLRGAALSRRTATRCSARRASAARSSR